MKGSIIVDDCPAHRDTRNGTPVPQGGGLWVADEAGTVFRSHNGQDVPGMSFSAQEQPLIFDACAP